MTGVHVAAPGCLLMPCAVISPQVFLYEARIITASPSAQTWRTFQLVFREDDARYGHMGALLVNSGSCMCSMVGLHLEARPLSRNLAKFTGLSLFLPTASAL